MAKITDRKSQGIPANVEGNNQALVIGSRLRELVSIEISNAEIVLLKKTANQTLLNHIFYICINPQNYVARDFGKLSKL